MKNIYFVQINDVYAGDREKIYIPYAVGCIEAYCLQNTLIASEYSFQKILYRRQDIDTVVRSMQEPFMVLFSCSVWNTEFNLALAAAVKKAFPACYITFGGHQVSSREDYLQEHPCIDFLVHRGGEEPTAQLLAGLALQSELSQIPNISFRSADGKIYTTPSVPQTGTDYPSPYLTGVFEEILQDDVDFSILLETNRGCPNNCAYCDWGTLHSAVRLFPMERVLREIDWIVEHKIEYVYCADANFCLFSRDAQIVDYIISCNQKYGYPKFFHVNFTKNRQEFVFDVSTRMIRSGLSKAQTIAFQSMHPQALSHVGRKNLTADHFRRLLKQFAHSGIATYSELILGLPGETYDSFCAGICALLEYGQHFSVNVYPCELLPNSEMGRPEYRKRYRINSTRVPFRLMHSTREDCASTVTEYAEYVTSTYSMRREEWASSLLFATYIQGLHNLGLLRAAAIYLRHACGISYQRFYQSLMDYSASHPTLLLGRLYRRIRALCDGVSRGENEFVATVPDTENILWGFDEMLYLYAYMELDTFFEEIRNWLVEKMSADETLEQLLLYQSRIIKRAGCSEIRIQTAYDFYAYFRQIYLDDPVPLQRAQTTIVVRDTHPVDSFAQYAREIVWYGRNRRETDYTSGFYPVEYMRKSRI